jgi:arginyl-tRNA synthetase
MQTLSSIISSHISALYGDISFSPTLSAPPKVEHGEYCFGVFTLAKPLGKAPNIIAEEIAVELRKDTEHFTQVNVIGGYVNFGCTTKIWMDILSQVEKTWPHKSNGKKAIMELFSLNVGKPLHIGHLCPTSTGQAIVNTHRYLGWDVIVDNHMGDWGSLFGKLIVGYEKYGDATKLERDGVDHLMEVYVQITADIEKDESVDQECKITFKKLSQWDPTLMELWGNFTRSSLEKANAVIEKLHVSNDVAIGEAFYEGLPLPKIWNHPALQYTMDDVIAELVEKKIATKNEDGSTGIDFQKYIETHLSKITLPEKEIQEIIKLPSTILEKRDGTHGYLASDLACVKYRMTNWWNPDKISIGTDVRQALHFRQVFATSKLAGWVDDVELIHVGNGFISLPDGAMSSRKWNIIRLEDLIEEGYIRTKTILETKWRTLSESDIREISIGAIKYSYLMQDRERNITFDWDKALSFEGNSGPYIQYACVRAGKIISEEQLRNLNFELWTLNFELSQYDTALIRTLAEMEGRIQTTADTYKPHTLALYCYDLAVCFNSFYVHTPKILEEIDTDLKNLRLHLCRLVAERLTLGFDLLAIKMPSEM